ncbi:MAG: photosynthetic complex putative assembly protein PuhB [Pseudomonadota bacterium]
MSRGEHDFEAARGLPGRLPPGERILWQGSPNWWALAKRAYFVRGVLIYFGIVAALRFVALSDDLGYAVGSTVALALPAALAVGILAVVAYASARTTVYTITDKRLVMRFGIAVPIALNLPFRQIGSASVRVQKDGSGDLPLALTGKAKIAYLHLWPHARPWRFQAPEPMLRAVPDAESVARLLATALADAAAATSTPPAAPVAAPGRHPVPAFAAE